MFFQANGMITGDPSLTADDYAALVSLVDNADIKGALAPRVAEIRAKLDYHYQVSLRSHFAPPPTTDEAAQSDIEKVIEEDDAEA